MNDESPPWIVPRAAYLHIPFCAHHCGYCDFAVTAGQDQLIDDYLTALEREVSGIGEPKAVQTIFVGGGTPTHLSVPQLDRFLVMVNRWFPRDQRVEFSIESTPDSLTQDKVDCLRHHGVSRVSIGVQSFHSGSLTSLDRQHRTEHIPEAVRLVKSAGLEVSLDLIFGAPGSTIETWQADLAAGLGFQPQHLSTYGLTYETGTPLWKQRKSGFVLPLTDDVELTMYELALDVIPENGYEHYEVSNFAKPGYRCRHNEIYWANHAHYGFGVGAAQYVNGIRTLNCRNTVDYIRRVSAGDSPHFQSEQLNELDRAFETIGVQLRRVAGIELTSFQRQTGFDLLNLASQTIDQLAGHGLLVREPDRVKLTRKGFPVTDSIIVELLKCQKAANG